MARTHAANLFSTELTAEMGATSLTASVLSTSGGPSSPALLVIDPPEDATTAARTEVVLFDGTFTGTSFVTSALANRYRQGSAAASGIVHPVGAKVISAPLGTQLEDLWDEIEDHGTVSGLAHGATAAATANTIVGRDANSRTSFNTPTTSTHAATKGYVDGQDTAHSDGTSAHSATSSATSNRIVLRDGSGRANFATPSTSANAATKGYVDGEISGHGHPAPPDPAVTLLDTYVGDGTVTARVDVGSTSAKHLRLVGRFSHNDSVSGLSLVRMRFNGVSTNTYFWLEDRTAGDGSGAAATATHTFNPGGDGQSGGAAANSVRTVTGTGGSFDLLIPDFQGASGFTVFSLDMNAVYGESSSNFTSRTLRGRWSGGPVTDIRLTLVGGNSWQNTTRLSLYGME